MIPSQAAPPAIEARSLSSLTALASNPPAYPRNPTHVKHDPLVLYIARVPGSKDVFLSPMKPRDKVVTAEDIQSSLYFVHVENPEDANLVEPERMQESQHPGVRQTPQISSPAIIQRKAVPGGQSAVGTPVRKPLPNTLSPIANFDSGQNIAAGRAGTLAPEYSPRRSYDSTQYRGEGQRPTTMPRRPSEIPRQYGTSLTLIRRDPASSAQWNVARIEDPPALDVSSASTSESPATRKPGAPMYLEIFNPGYSKFIHTEEVGRPFLASQGSNISTYSKQQNSLGRPQLQEKSGDRMTMPDDITFRRRIWMEGTQHAGSGFGHRKNHSYDYDAGRPDSRGSSYGDNGKSSMDGHPQPPPSFLTREDQNYSTIHVSDRQTSFRGYVFMSPWNGRCEFVTGAGGGSLKCRHVVPGLQGAAPTASQVSELRFNLPGSSKAVTPRADEGSKRSSFFHRGRHSRNNSSISVNRDEGVEGTRNSMDRMDLSLGQEFAGGGFGGKQAKLGKMIIEDEGLKMMDLLVAANVGLWWRAYEKAIKAS